MSSTSTESVGFSNISASTSPFALRGGKYAAAVLATFGGGSVTLQMLGPDGSTYVTCLTAFTAAGYGVADLPPGQYRFTIATATAVYASLTRIPA